MRVTLPGQDVRRRALALHSQPGVELALWRRVRFPDEWRVAWPDTADELRRIGRACRVGSVRGPPPSERVRHSLSQLQLPDKVPKVNELADSGRRQVSLEMLYPFLLLQCLLDGDTPESALPE